MTDHTVHNTPLIETISQIGASPPPLKADVPAWAPELIRLLEYWKSIIPAQAQLPARKDFVPTDIPKLLPHIWLMELGEDLYSHRYRLAGSSVAASVGKDYTGKRLVDVHPTLPDRPEAYRFIEEICEARIPHWYNGYPRADHSEKVVRIQNLIAPLGTDGEQVDHLVGIAIMQLERDTDYNFESPTNRSYLGPG